MIDWLEHNLLPCFLKSHFGLECPGCGMQRSLIALLKGDILESLHYHVALIPFIITISLLIAQLIIKHEKGKWGDVGFYYYYRRYSLVSVYNKAK
ncbi:MAG: DUF2752 domain-containing protein [Bacteroidetes bacterium]|nr:DUF2752 domain-containing protein [Bacteroidota bacterium]